jgi:hypothetical protein
MVAHCQGMLLRDLQGLRARNTRAGNDNPPKSDEPRRERRAGSLTQLFCLLLSAHRGHTIEDVKHYTVLYSFRSSQSPYAFWHSINGVVRRSRLAFGVPSIVSREGRNQWPRRNRGCRATAKHNPTLKSAQAFTHHLYNYSYVLDGGYVGTKHNT